MVKADIVAKYLWAWAKVVIPTSKHINNRIAYIDLFAGPGRYRDGTKSTPLLILDRAINDIDMRNMLVTIFSDADPNNAKSLQSEINNIENINLLKYKPKVYVSIVDYQVADIFNSIKMIPSFVFLDPWGYKGLSYRLVNSVIKDWGCECIIFFNYNRINMGLNNIGVQDHMNALFGKENADKLREQLKSTLKPNEREILILNALTNSFKDLGGKYVLPFRFRGETGNRISHHLIFVTKHIKGYDIMKTIMANASSSDEQGVPSFEYSPIKENQYHLFSLNEPINKLKQDLLNCFTGKTLSMLDIYNQHNVGTCYIKANYKQVLLELEREGLIKTSPAVDNRRKMCGNNTLADTVKITFP